MPVKHNADDNRKVVMLTTLIILVFSVTVWRGMHGGETAERSARETENASATQPVSDTSDGATRLRILDKELDSPLVSQSPPAISPDAFRPLASTGPSDGGSNSKEKLPVSDISVKSPELLPAPSNTLLSLAPAIASHPPIMVSAVLDGISINDMGEPVAGFTLGKPGEPLRSTLERTVGQKIGASKIAAIGEDGVLLVGNHTWWRIGEFRSVIGSSLAPPIVIRNTGASGAGE